MKITVFIFALAFSISSATEVAAKEGFLWFRKKKNSETTKKETLPKNVEIRKALPYEEHSAKGTTTENDVARFLAGLSGNSSNLENLRRSQIWKGHASNMDQRWSRSSARLSKIRSWRRGALSGVGNGTVFYPFGGPDILYTTTFFPNANTFYLVGLEPVGSVPDLTTMSDAQLGSALSGIETSVSTALDFSFFITKDMRRDLQSTPLQGALPILYAFLARTDHSISSVERVSLTSSGGVVKSSNGNGVRIRCSGSGGAKTVHYFRYDLSNSGGGGFDKLMRSNGSGTTFLKSASYLLHSNEFSNIRSSILAGSNAILQDPSGVPYSYYQSGSWDVTNYGNYVRTLDMFSEYYQPNMVTAFEANSSRLGFGIGYVYTEGESSLVLARK
jgi:hypothetical protein